MSQVSKETVTVMVPVRYTPAGGAGSGENRLQLLRQCLASLLSAVESNRLQRSSRWKSVTIMVIDDNSNVPIGSVLGRDLKDRVEVLPNKGTPGQAGALNYAMAKIDSDVYGFTDSDCAVATEWLTAMAEHYNSHPEHKAVAGPNWLFMNAPRPWARILTRQESLLMQFVFKLYLDRKRRVTRRIDCRNLSIRSEFLTECSFGDLFFVENRGPAVSGLTTHSIQHWLPTTKSGIGFEPKLRVYHKSVDSLRAQLRSYYLRGRHGEFDVIYSRDFVSLSQAFVKRYFSRHFVRPCIHGGVSWIYALLAHGVFWLGIVQSHVSRD